MNLVSQKMGLHSWSYGSSYDESVRSRMSHVDLVERFKALEVEVELGFDPEQTAVEVARCLNCDIQTDFTANLCIECDACIDVCPVYCLTMTENEPEEDLRLHLTAPAENTEQDLYVSTALPQTARVMVKDEDLCVHCLTLECWARGRSSHGRQALRRLPGLWTPVPLTRRRYE